jgi:hypothetical protein
MIVSFLTGSIFVARGSSVKQQTCLIQTPGFVVSRSPRSGKFEGALRQQLQTVLASK